MIEIPEEELDAEGYLEIVDQTDDGEVLLLTVGGAMELFQVRDSHSGWHLDTTDGRVLEFVRSIS